MRPLGLVLALCAASVVRAADESILELSDNYFQCAAFYKGAKDAGMLPKGRSDSRVEQDVSWATETATGLGITARDGPRRMTIAENQATARRVAKKARDFSAQLRDDPGHARTWIAEVFAHCDDKMALSGRPKDQP